MSNSASFDGKLKSWYKVVARATNDTIYQIKDTISGKPAPIENDPLAEARHSIEDFRQLVQSMQVTCQQFVHVLEGFRTKETETVSLALIADGGSFTNQLKQSVSTYTNCYSNLVVYIDDGHRSMQQLLCDIRNKLLTIMQVLKKFDSRDKAFHKMEMEEKKWQKALEAGDPKIIERRAKAEKSRADYEAILNETKLEAEGLLETKDSFIESTFIALRRIEAGFYRKLAESFDRLDKQRSASFTTIYDSSHQPLRYSNNQVGNPFDTPAKGELHQPTTEAIIVEKRLPPQQLTSALGGQTNQSLWNQQSPQQYGQQSRTSEFESDVLNTLDIDLM